MDGDATTARRIELLYDRQCPACDYYCQRVDIAESSDRLCRIDARDESTLLDEVTAAGLDIDAGMVLKLDDQIHYGSDAIHQLALLSSKKGFVNRVGGWLFQRRGAARVLYPILAAARNLLLKILGRSRINNLQLKNNERF